jgi:hypothetical protein
MVLFFVGRPLWREDGSVFCVCWWPFPAQSFSGPSPLGLATIFYSLGFETSLFVASYDSQGHGGGIRPRLHTGWDRLNSCCFSLYSISTGQIENIAFNNSSDVAWFLVTAEMFLSCRCLAKDVFLGLVLWLSSVMSQYIVELIKTKLNKYNCLSTEINLYCIAPCVVSIEPLKT